MIIKAEVTQEEKKLVEARAKDSGQSISGYIKERVFDDGGTTRAIAGLLRCAEEQAKASMAIRDLATHAVAGKAVYASELKALLVGTARLEKKADRLLRIATRVLDGGDSCGNLGEHHN